MGRTIAATCMALAISAGLSGAAVARPSGPADEPWERGFEQDTSNSARVVVELGSLDAQTAAHLALLLPNWDEQINAGAEQLTLPRSLAESLVASGEPLRIVSNAPDIPLIWPSCIPKLDEVYSWLDAFAATHPDLVEVIDIGDSWCKIEGDCETPRRDSIPGDDLYVVRVTNERSTASKSGRLFIDAGMHARELSTIPLIQAMIESLVQEYGTDPQVTWLLDHREIYLGIATNPDGRRLAELGTEPPYNGGPWYFRKNGHRTPRACSWPPTAANQYGVDLNRNHVVKWNSPGHSLDPCAQLYRGEEPASEPETRAYENFVRSIIDDQRGDGDDDPAPLHTSGMLINYHNHTPTGTVLVPWGWTTEKSPNDEGLVAIAQRYSALNGYAWKYALYAVSGNTRDWAYGELGIPAYVVELKGTDFVSTCVEINRAITDNVKAIQLSLGISDRPYDRIRGPEVGDIPPPPDVSSGSMMRLEAPLSARRVRSTVHGAEVLIGKAGGPDTAWPVPAPDAPRGMGLPMTAADGAFDLALETGVAEIDTTGFAAGEYYAVVRAVGPEGHWGPGKAIFFTVSPGPEPMETPAPSDTPSPTATETPTMAPTPTIGPSSTPEPTPTEGPGPSPTPGTVPTSTPVPTVSLPCNCELFLPWSRAWR